MGDVAVRFMTDVGVYGSKLVSGSQNMAECPFCGRRGILFERVVYRGTYVEKRSYSAYCGYDEDADDGFDPCPMILEYAENFDDIEKALDHWNDAMAMLDRKGV